jgi:hypothetical protein
MKQLRFLGAQCSRVPYKRKPRQKGTVCQPKKLKLRRISALTCLKTRVAFVDHVGTSLAADDAAKAITLFRGFERIDDFHFSLPSTHLLRVGSNFYQIGVERNGGAVSCQRIVGAESTLPQHRLNNLSKPVLRHL